MKTRILIISFLFSLLIFLLPLNTHANTDQQLNFSNASDKYLFDISNMKPGDWATRNLEIQNQIEEEFTYSAKAKFKGGSKKLFKEFKLRVWDANGVELYSGKLNEFKDLSPRFLESGSKEIITFEATFPNELGNEFQGQRFEFELRFTRKGTTHSLGTGSDPKPEPKPDAEPTDPSPESNPNPEQDEEETLELNSNGNDSEGEPDQGEGDSDTELDLEDGSLNEELTDLPVHAQILPATSTKMFNTMFLGTILLISGSGLYVLKRKRKRME